VLGAWGGARPGHSKRNFVTFVSFCLIHLEIFNSTSTGVRMTNFQDANFDDFTSHRRVKRSPRFNHPTSAPKGTLALAVVAPLRGTPPRLFGVLDARLREPRLQLLAAATVLASRPVKVLPRLGHSSANLPQRHRPIRMQRGLRCPLAERPPRNQAPEKNPARVEQPGAMEKLARRPVFSAAHAGVRYRLRSYAHRESTIQT
jgi:hypothetical protein